MKPASLAIVLGLAVWQLTSPINAQDVTRAKLVYELPDMNKVRIQQSILYNTQKNLGLDIYYPPDIKSGETCPAVILVLGYANNVFETKLKDWQFYISWAKLIAASGMIAVNYETLQPADDVVDVVAYIRNNAAALQIDENRIGIWSCSANVLTASTLLFSERKEYLRCAVFYYGLLLTPDHKYRDAISALTKQVNFSTDGIDRIKYFHQDLPLFILRAGKDMEIFKQVADYFTAMALANNVPLTCINYADGGHGFDMSDDNDISRAIIQQTLDFLTFNLDLNKNVKKIGNQ